MNQYMKEGSEAVYHFMNDEISVYGSSETIQGKVPRVEIINLDYMRFAMEN